MNWTDSVIGNVSNTELGLHESFEEEQELEFIWNIWEGLIDLFKKSSVKDLKLGGDLLVKI